MRDEEENALDVDLMFGERQPRFGDLFTLTGRDNPRVPPSGQFDFTALAALGYDQVDDYFGVPNDDMDGDEDVILWLFPLVRGRVATHHDGPFNGVRLTCGTPVEGQRRLLLERSVAALLPICDTVIVDGMTIAQGAPLDGDRVATALAARLSPTRG